VYIDRLRKDIVRVHIVLKTCIRRGTTDFKHFFFVLLCLC
jgi:hypothetical protein